MTLLFIPSWLEMQVVSLLLNLTVLTYWQKKGAFQGNLREWKLGALAAPIAAFPHQAPCSSSRQSRSFQTSSRDMLYLCLFENQNNNIPNPISIYIWKSCSWCSQDPTWKVDGVQRPNGLACRKNRMKETCSTWGTSRQPQRVPQNLLKKGAKEVVPPILYEEERQTGASCSLKQISSPSISSDCLWVKPQVLLCFLLSLSLERPEPQTISETAENIWGSLLEEEPKWECCSAGQQLFSSASSKPCR